jgi:ABC-type multidrug transport system ATPase subunit
MDEAGRCNRVALIKDGYILKTDTPVNIESQFENSLYAIKAKGFYQLLKVLKSSKNVQHAYAFGQDIHLVVEPGRDLQNIKGELEAQSIDFHDLRKVNASIEDCFIQEMIKINVDHETA